MFRAKSSAILSSSSTIIADNPRLNIRFEEFNSKISSIIPKKIFQYPIRVILDSQNRIQPFHKIIQTKGDIWLIRLKRDQNIWPKHIKQIIGKEYENKINIYNLLKFLGQSDINNVWIEAGSQLSGFLLKNSLIDELILYVAPKILGHEAQSLCMIYNILHISNAIQFEFQDIRQIGSDIRLILSPKK